MHYNVEFNSFVEDCSVVECDFRQPLDSIHRDVCGIMMPMTEEHWKAKVMGMEGSGLKCIVIPLLGGEVTKKKVVCGEVSFRDLMKVLHDFFHNPIPKSDKILFEAAVAHSKDEAVVKYSDTFYHFRFDGGKIEEHGRLVLYDLEMM